MSHKSCQWISTCQREINIILFHAMNETSVVEQLKKDLRSELARKGNDAFRRAYSEEQRKKWRNKGIAAIRAYWKKKRLEKKSKNNCK